MLLIPAIDLKDGHCVRLKQGDMDQSTTFGEDPATMMGISTICIHDNFTTCQT